MADQFTNFQKTANSPTIVGTAPDGQRVAFENEQQFNQVGGNFDQVKTVNNTGGFINFSNFKINPAASIPAPTVADKITSGDVNSLLKQNQANYQAQLQAMDLSPEYISLKKQFNNTNQQLAGLQTNYIQNQVGIKNKPIPMDEIGNELTRLQENVAFRQIPLTNQLQAITGQLGILQEERAQTLAKLQLTADQGRYDTGLAMQFNEIKRAEQTEARKLAREYGVESQFYNEGGTIYRTSDGKAYSNEEEFFKDAGVYSFEDAKEFGLLTDLGETLAMRLEREKMGRQAFESDRAFDFNVDTFNEEMAFKREAFSFEQQMELEQLQLDKEAITYEQTKALLGAKELSAEQKKLNAIALGAQNDLDAMESFLFDENGNLNRVSGILKKGLGMDRQFQAAVTNVKDSLGRLRSGGAITEDELKTFQSLIPNITYDGRDTIVSKLARLRGIFNEITPQGGVRQTDQDFLDYEESKSGGANKTSFLGASSLSSLLTKKFPAGSVGGQCGDFARKVAGSLGLTYPRLGDGLNSKISVVQKYGTTNLGAAKPGSIIVTKENPTYGHVAVIIGRNKDGFIVTESNFKQSNKVSYNRIIPYGSTKIVGIINPTRA